MQSAPVISVGGVAQTEQLERASLGRPDQGHTRYKKLYSRQADS